MKTNGSSVRVLAAGVLALALVAGFSWRAGAESATGPAVAPTSVAVLNVETVLNGLDELGEFNTRLQARVDGLQMTLDQLKAQIEGKEAEFNELSPVAVGDRRRVRAEMFELEAQAKARTEVLQTLLNIEKGEAIRAIYLKLLDATADVASKAGYDIVLFDDRGVVVHEGLPDRNVNAIIQSKRILYATDAIDISDQVKAYMNNMFRAGARN